jgi:NTP pyrophosphatase (non-canonical NTP hydrolase)
MNAQEIVAANVAARGYRDGWTAEQFVARQLAKLTEEIGEAVEQVHPGEAPSALYRWFDHAGDAYKAARRVFDTPDLWRKTYIIDPNAVRSELADMLVVLFAAAQALDFDAVQAAIDKSSADVARGVR